MWASMKFLPNLEFDLPKKKEEMQARKRPGDHALVVRV